MHSNGIVLQRLILGMFGLLLLLPLGFFCLLWFLALDDVSRCCDDRWAKHGFNECQYAETSAMWWGCDADLIMPPAINLLPPPLLCFWYALKPRRKRMA